MSKPKDYHHRIEESPDARHGCEMRWMPLVTAFKWTLWKMIVLILEDCVKELSEVSEFLVHNRIEGLLLSMEGLLLSQPIVTFFDGFLKLEKTGTICHGNGTGEKENSGKGKLKMVCGENADISKNGKNERKKMMNLDGI